MSAHLLTRNQDRYRRAVVASALVRSMADSTVFALQLDCGHTVYADQGKVRGFRAPQHIRCKVCIVQAIGSQQPLRRTTPAEAAVAGYISGARVGVIDAARAAIALERLS